MKKPSTNRKRQFLRNLPGVKDIRRPSFVRAMGDRHYGGSRGVANSGEAGKQRGIAGGSSEASNGVSSHGYGASTSSSPHTSLQRTSLITGTHNYAQRTLEEQHQYPNKKKALLTDSSAATSSNLPYSGTMAYNRII